MTLLVQIGFIFTINLLQSSAQSCDNILKVKLCEFIDDDGNHVIIESDESSCLKFPEHCCWNGTECYNKELQTAAQLEKNVTTEEYKLPYPFPEPDEDESAGNDSRRSLSQKCITFPSTCQLTRNEPYVRDPPVNIPYCLRIPCSSDVEMQAVLENDHLKCGVRPGCYFDVELSRLREQLSPSVLAGVPSCHYVIRKPVFKEKALLVVQKYGFWNPYFTNCLLNTFQKELAVEHPGCHVIPALLTFKIAPKLKGWRGITSNDCRLIDGCWRPGEGCFEPVDPNQVTVKSTQQNLFNPFVVRHGRPICRPFNSANSFEIMKSYHQCYSSGCSVDMTVGDFYYTHLYNIGYQMSVRDHQLYWKDVMQGKIATIKDLESMTWKRNASKPTTGPTLPTKCGGRSNRPCKPLSPPPLFGNQACPYIPPIVPKSMQPLKGSFEGCCDINICYKPKKHIQSSYSGPSAYYTGWSFYSSCSAGCGSGTRKRFRKCISHDDSLCTETLEHTSPCDNGPCAKWSNWGPFGKCRGKIGRRFKKRIRKCVPKGGKCHGPKVNRVRCKC